MPKIFPEDTKREGGQGQKNVGVADRYASEHGITHAERLGHTPGRKSRTKNTSHLTSDSDSPAGGTHDNESATVRRNYQLGTISPSV